MSPAAILELLDGELPHGAADPVMNWAQAMHELAALTSALDLEREAEPSLRSIHEQALVILEKAYSATKQLTPPEDDADARDMVAEALRHPLFDGHTGLQTSDFTALVRTLGGAGLALINPRQEADAYGSFAAASVYAAQLAVRTS